MKWWRWHWCCFLMTCMGNSLVSAQNIPVQNQVRPEVKLTLLAFQMEKTITDSICDTIPVSFEWVIQGDSQNKSEDILSKNLWEADSMMFRCHTSAAFKSVVFPIGLRHGKIPPCSYKQLGNYSPQYCLKDSSLLQCAQLELTAHRCGDNLFTDDAIDSIAVKFKDVVNIVLRLPDSLLKESKDKVERFWDLDNDGVVDLFSVDRDTLLLPINTMAARTIRFGYRMSDEVLKEKKLHIEVLP